MAKFSISSQRETRVLTNNVKNNFVIKPLTVPFEIQYLITSANEINVYFKYSTIHINRCTIIIIEGIPTKHDNKHVRLRMPLIKYIIITYNMGNG